MGSAYYDRHTLERLMNRPKFPTLVNWGSLSTATNIIHGSILHRSSHPVIVSLRNRLILGRLIFTHARRYAFDKGIRIRREEVRNGESFSSHATRTFVPI